jgi:cardiolipin synthase A/B
MNSILLADVMVSTTFIVFAYIAIAAAALVIFVGLFDPGLRYKISVSAADDNRSQSFLHTLEALADSKVQQRMKLTVLTNGTEFYEEELRTIEAATRSVNLEAYIFKRGAIAQRYIDALTGRARAGRVEGEVVPNLQATLPESSRSPG